MLRTEDLLSLGLAAAALLVEHDSCTWARGGALGLLGIEDDVIGCWLRLRRGVRPLVIHPG